MNILKNYRNKTQFSNTTYILLSSKLLVFFMFLKKKLEKLKNIESLVKKKNKN